MNLIKFGILVINFFSLTALYISGQTSDFSTWNKLTISTKIGPKLEFDLTQEFRLNNNSSQFDEIFTDFDINYSILKFLELTGSYRFIKNRKKDRSWETLHRFDADLKLKTRIRRFEGEYRFRFESYPDFANENKEGVFFLRHKFEVGYDIRKCKFFPFLSSELFHEFKNDGTNRFKKLRLTLGATYNLNKYHRIGAYSRFHKEYNVKNPETDYILGINYKWKLKFNKKKNKKKVSLTG